MTPRQYLELLNAIEASLPVHEWQISGIPVWPVLRIQLGFALDDFSKSQPTTAPPSMLTSMSRMLERSLRSVARHVRAARADREHNARAQQPVDVVFMTHTTCRVFEAKGGWYDQYCEPIIELLEARGRSWFAFEHAPGDEYRIPRTRSSMFIQAQVTGLRTANEVVRARHRPLPGESELLAILREHDVTPPLAAIRKQIHVIRLVADHLKGHLRRLQPSLGIGVNYYDNVGMAFNVACRELGITSVDIQHGVQGELHLSYGRWTHVPREGYAVLPSLFWCWTPGDAANINAWAAATDAHRALVGGNQILMKFLRGNDDVVANFDRMLGTTPGANILVSLRPRAGMPAILRDAIAAAPPTWKWWIRLHPAMMSERADVVAALDPVRDRVDVEQATRLPLYALLRRVDVHVTEASSVVIEGAQFGVPSVICHPTGAELFAQQISDGIAVSTTSIVEAVTRQLAIGKRPPASPIALDADGLDQLVASHGARP